MTSDITNVSATTVIGREAQKIHAQSSFINACNGVPAKQVPVWFMRQAGRSLPEYKAIRGTGSILDAINQPELAAEITRQPVARYNVDAAILYSDIVVPVSAIGFGVEVVNGTGPVIQNPFTTEKDLQRFRPLEPDVDLQPMIATIDMLVKDLDVPLIGFAGAPFTVASYLIEGGPSKTYLKTKTLMYSNPMLWHALLDQLADLAITTLHTQIDYGACAIQLFDSWAGTLSAYDYTNFVAPHTQKIFSNIASRHVPRIHFGVGTGEILGEMASTGPDVMGVDWRTPLSVARDRISKVAPHVRALQGNLDPAICAAPWEVVAEQVRHVLQDNAAHPGHVFNLGHGVLPELNPEILEQIVALVHEEGRTDG